MHAEFKGNIFLSAFSPLLDLLLNVTPPSLRIYILCNAFIITSPRSYDIPSHFIAYVALFFFLFQG